jgi:hypothetical protein
MRALFPLRLLNILPKTANITEWAQGRDWFWPWWSKKLVASCCHLHVFTKFILDVIMFLPTPSPNESNNYRFCLWVCLTPFKSFNTLVALIELFRPGWKNPPPFLGCVEINKWNWATILWAPPRAIPFVEKPFWWTTLYHQNHFLLIATEPKDPHQVTMTSIWL